MVVPMYLRRCVSKHKQAHRLRRSRLRANKKHEQWKNQYAIPEIDKLPSGLAVHGREKETIFRPTFFFFFLFLGKARLSPSAERFFLLIKISIGSCLTRYFNLSFF